MTADEMKKLNPFFPVTEVFADRGSRSSYIVAPDTAPEEYEARIADLVTVANQAEAQQKAKEVLEAQRAALLTALRGGKASPTDIATALALLLERKL